MRHRSLAKLARALVGAAITAAVTLPGATLRAQSDTPGALAFFEPVRGALDASNPIDEWALAGYAGQPIALLATGSDSLDPMLEVIAPDGTSVAANDDLDSLVRDAGFEALALPDDGVYTVRVRRYEGSRGATSGDYELLALPGYAEVVRRDTFAAAETTWAAVGAGAVEPFQGRLRLRAPGSGGSVFATPTDLIPLRDLYYEAEARLSGAASYAEFGLVVRAPAEAEPAGQGYTFKVNTAGQWTVIATTEAGEFTLQGWSAAPSLAAETWTLGVLAQDTTLSFYANGALLGTIADGRLVSAGTVGLMAATDAGQDDLVTVLFDNVVITRRLGTTYRGMPLALTTWADTNPARIMAELAESGRIMPAPGHDLYVNNRALDATTLTSLFETIGSEQALYRDFVFGASIVIATEGESSGCGLLFHMQDDRNLSLAYVDAAGGFGLVRAHDGVLTANVYDRIPPSQTTPDRLLVITQGERVTLYVNGALVAQEPLGADIGRVGLALLNYENTITRCVFGDMWVWLLADEESANE